MIYEESCDWSKKKNQLQVLHFILSYIKALEYDEFVITTS